MSYRMEIGTFLLDWWQFVVFLGGAAVAFIVGKERQRFRVDQVGKDFEILSAKVDMQSMEIEKLKAQGNSEAVTLAQIVTSQTYILASFEEIKETLRGKADK